MPDPMNTSKPLPAWMRQIIDTPSLMSSFLNDMNDREFRATEEGVRLSKQGKHTEANVLFGKAEAFLSMMNSVTIHLRESEAQDAFQSQQATGTTRKRSTR